MATRASAHSRSTSRVPKPSNGIGSATLSREMPTGRATEQRRHREKPCCPVCVQPSEAAKQSGFQILLVASCLGRKQPVIRIEADVRTPFHRLSENVRSQSSGKCRRNGLFEEEPHMRAWPGA